MQKDLCTIDQQDIVLSPLYSLVNNICKPETITTTPMPTPSQPPRTTTKIPTSPTNGRETRADTGCMDWRNVMGRSLGSDCDDAADYMCSHRIPPTDAANCWVVKNEFPCCKKVKVIKGRHYLSECLSDCTGDPNVCRERYPATKAAKCSVRPSSKSHSMTTCCVAEFIYT